MRELLLQSVCTADWALNSAVECHLHTVEVTGSNPVAPTIPTFLRMVSACASGFRFTFPGPRFGDAVPGPVVSRVNL
jgi:hypothetical protein